MLRLIVCAVLAGTVVLAGCDYLPDAPPPVAVEEGPPLRTTVKLEVYRGEELCGYGSGVAFRYVIDEAMRFSTQILTAAHVVPEGPEFTLVARFWSGEYWSEKLPVQVKAVCRNRDVAVVEVPYAAPALAVLGWNTPDRYGEVYTTGVCALQIPLPDPGVVTGRFQNFASISAHVEYGRSGGAVWAQREDGTWVVVGIIQAVGVQRWGPVHHLALMCPIEVIRVWLIEVDAKL